MESTPGLELVLLHEKKVFPPILFHNMDLIFIPGEELSYTVLASKENEGAIPSVTLIVLRGSGLSPRKGVSSNPRSTTPHLLRSMGIVAIVLGMITLKKGVFHLYTSLL